MAKPLPTSFTAGRPLRVGATVYAVGDTIAVATVKAIKHVSALLSDGYIVPAYASGTQRRGFKAANRPPLSLGAVERRAL